MSGFHTNFAVAAANSGSGWIGAPPACSGCFAFANGEFFAEASGHNRHRRATLSELQTHFTKGNERDYSAHWFEAQLLHYGLQPSRVKAVARMRLLDAVNAQGEGKLVVPANMLGLEDALKKEWTKRDREAKRGLHNPARGPSGLPNRGLKREAYEDYIDSAPRDTKRVKNELSPLRPATPTSSQTTNIYIKQADTYQDPAVSSPPFWNSGVTPSLHSPSHQSFPSNTQTPPRSFGRDPAHKQHHCGDDWGNSYGDEKSGVLSPLGLLNGDYHIESPAAMQRFSRQGPNLGLTFTLSGNELWGSFSLCLCEGVLCINERPRWSSQDEIWFTWRGLDDKGFKVSGNPNSGWIKFLGQGRIEGWLDHHDIYFHGDRLPGQGTRSSIDARTMKNEWRDYDARNQSDPGFEPPWC